MGTWYKKECHSMVYSAKKVSSVKLYMVQEETDVNWYMVQELKCQTVHGAETIITKRQTMV